MFSVSVIYSTKDFLSQVNSSSLTPQIFESAFRRFSYSEPEKILELSFSCGWIKLKPSGEIVLTSRGEEINCLDYLESLVLQLEDMIFCYNPEWAALLPKGREETKHFLPQNVLQCFKEAKLFGEINERIIGIWDKFSIAYRKYHQQKLLEIGRQGEYLSLQYEQERTGTKPMWQSIESNLSGYDILSVIERESSTKIKIEVKSTSSQIDYATFYLSKNEWETAELSQNYIFHLWELTNKKLYVVNKEIIGGHVPSDSGFGDWREVRIPFKNVI